MEESEVKEKILGYLNDYQTQLLELCKVKAESPFYDPNWQSKKDLLSILNTAKETIEAFKLPSIKDLQIFNDDKHTPSLFYYLEPTDKAEAYSILFYSHLDKIPMGQGWTKCDPLDPKVIDNYAYGRGVSTGIISFFLPIIVSKVIQHEIEEKGLDVKLPKIGVIIETSNEKNSQDLEYHLETNIKPIFNQPSLIIALEGQTPNYKNIQYYKSGRGELSFDVKVSTIKHGVHSGILGGMVPEALMIMQNIIEKFEKLEGRDVTIKELELPITDAQMQEAQTLTSNVGLDLISYIPNRGVSKFIGEVDGDEQKTYLNCYINSTLKPSFNVVGQEGIERFKEYAGKIRPNCTLRFKFRIPPTLSCDSAFEKISKIINDSPLFGAKIDISNKLMIDGFDLEDKKILPKQKILDTLNTCASKLGKNQAILRFPYSMNCINILNKMFQDVPILITGGGCFSSGKTRDEDENVSLNMFAEFATKITFFLSLYNDYKE